MIAQAGRVSMMGRVSADHGKWPRGCCLRLVARSEQAACVTQVGAGSQPGSNQALSENMGFVKHPLSGALCSHQSDGGNCLC